jgi:transposase-like protein
MKRAMGLLSDGYTVSSVAENLGLSRQTVTVWRDSPEGKALLEAACADRDREFRDTVTEARSKLKSLARRAVEVLEDQLESGDEDTAGKAAKTILDRVGLPRTERLELSAERLNLSALSDDELRVYEMLRRKALAGAEPVALAAAASVATVDAVDGEGEEVAGDGSEG